MKILSALLIALLIFSSQEFADQATLAPEAQQGQAAEAPQAAKIKTQVQKRGADEKSKVRVTLENGTVVKGYISKIDDLSFEVTSNKTGQATSIVYTNVRKVQGPGLSTGEKIGIGVGVAVVVVAIIFVVAWEQFKHSSGPSFPI